MIEQRTVFVLGAGASIPYGFPSGRELRSLLSNRIGENFSQMRNALQQHFSISGKETEAFQDAFLKSGQSSIDAFLSKRVDLAQIGKLCIAYQIYMREANQRVHAPSDANDDWLLYLWQGLQHGASNPNEILKNNVKFVTFNYDRTLECFLYEAIKNSFMNCESDEALEVLDNMDILHVYGKLAKYGPVQDKDHMPFPPRIDHEALQLAAESLKVIPEARAEDPSFKTSNEWFRWAERICFLGFGFDPLNMERLGLQALLTELGNTGAKRPKVFASVFNLEPMEINQNVLPYISGASNHHAHGLHVGEAVLPNKNLDFLRKVNFLG